MIKPTHTLERKDFIGRMIGDFNSINWPRELLISKKIFAKFNLEFLGEVKRPFKMNSIAWFLGAKGSKWLEEKQREYYHFIAEAPKTVTHDEKAGEDIPREKTQTLKDFLNGS